MQLAASIFKAYDIRGIVPTTLDEDVARALGRAFGSAARAAGEQVVMRCNFLIDAESNLTRALVAFTPPAAQP